MTDITHLPYDPDEYGEEYVSEEEYEEEEYLEEEEDDDEPAPTGMAAMIAAAASRRSERIQSNGGELQISQPEEQKGFVNEAPPTDMAAAVAALANKRNERIEAGGEVQVREVPEEHKNVFVTVAEAAASMGRLTRLNEKVVEAVSAEKIEEEDDNWGPSGLRTDNIRSNHFMVINEAAALGQMRRLKPVETTNYVENPADDESSEEEDIDKKVDEKGRRIVRTNFLLDQHVKQEKKTKDKEWAPENLNQVNYKSIDEVELPTKKLPGFKPKPSKLSEREAMDAISNAVAERAWERNYRLGRPNAPLRVTRKCDCKYCVNPNPFQTHAYKKMWIDHLTNPEPEEPEVVEEPPKPKKPEWKPPTRTAPPPEFQKPPSKRFKKPKPGETPKTPSSRPLKKTRPPPKVRTVPTPPPVEEPPPKPKPPAPKPEDEFGDLELELPSRPKKSSSSKKKKKSSKKKKKKKQAQQEEGCACIIM